MRVFSVREPFRPGLDPSVSIRSLAAHRFLMRTALSAVNLFAWVFVFQYFFVVYGDIAHAFARTALLYALVQAVICLMTPLSAWLLRFGTRRALIEAALFAALGYTMLGASLSGIWRGAYIPLALTGFAVLMGLYRAFYWLPYEAELHESRAVRRSTWREVFIALMPLAAGVTIMQNAEAPLWVLFTGAIMMLLSGLPLRRVRDVHEKLEWSYRRVFAEFAAAEHRDLIRGALLEGALGTALLFLWPIAIYIIVGWSYGILGLVLSASFIAAIIGRRFVRGSVRELSLHRSPVVTALLVTTPWIFRMSIASPLAVVLVDSYFYTTTPTKLGMDPVAFEQASDAGYFLDEYTAIKEIGQAIGRLAMSLLVALFALILPLPVVLIGAFALAAFLSLWVMR
jgi:hypothetical protein